MKFIKKIVGFIRNTTFIYICFTGNTIALRLIELGIKNWWFPTVYIGINWIGSFGLILFGTGFYYSVFKTNIFVVYIFGIIVYKSRERSKAEMLAGSNLVR